MNSFGHNCVYRWKWDTLYVADRRRNKNGSVERKGMLLRERGKNILITWKMKIFSELFLEQATRINEYLIEERVFSSKILLQQYRCSLHDQAVDIINTKRCLKDKNIQKLEVLWEEINFNISEDKGMLEKMFNFCKKIGPACWWKKLSRIFFLFSFSLRFYVRRARLLWKTRFLSIYSCIIDGIWNYVIYMLCIIYIKLRDCRHLLSEKNRGHFCYKLQYEFSIMTLLTYQNIFWLLLYTHTYTYTYTRFY